MAESAGIARLTSKPAGFAFLTRSLLIACPGLPRLFLPSAAGQRAAAQSPNLVTNGYFDHDDERRGRLLHGHRHSVVRHHASQWAGTPAATTSCNSMPTPTTPSCSLPRRAFPMAPASGPTNGFSDPWDAIPNHGVGNSSNTHGLSRSLWGAGNGGVGQDGQSGRRLQRLRTAGRRTIRNNFLIADGDYHKDRDLPDDQQSGCGRSLHGESFDWGARRSGIPRITGATTEQWQVNLRQFRRASPAVYST